MSAIQQPLNYDFANIAEALRQLEAAQSEREGQGQIWQDFISKASSQTASSASYSKHVKPEHLLLASALFTFYANVSYVGEYAKKTMDYHGAAAIGTGLNTAAFASFTVEKAADIFIALEKSFENKTADNVNSRRNFIREFYPLIAASWLSINQGISGLGFTTEAISGDSKQGWIATMRATAFIASVGMLVYKYRQAKKKDPASLEVLPKGYHAILEKLDNRLGPLVDRCGDSFPYMAAALLAGPHAIKFTLDMTQNPRKFSHGSLTATIGYGLFVAYLAQNNNKTDDSIVTSFSSFADGLKNKNHITSRQIERLLCGLGLSETSAAEITTSLPRTGISKAVLLEKIIDHYAAGITQQFVETTASNTDLASSTIHETELADALRTYVKRELNLSSRPNLEEKIVVEATKSSMNRRQFLGLRM